MCEAKISRVFTLTRETVVPRPPNKQARVSGDKLPEKICRQSEPSYIYLREHLFRFFFFFKRIVVSVSFSLLSYSMKLIPIGKINEDEITIYRSNNRIYIIFIFTKNFM
jgi:hypothetical protein